MIVQVGLGIGLIDLGIGLIEIGIVMIELKIGLIELGIGLIELGIGLMELGIVLMEPGIGLMELGVGLMELGVGLGINNARRTVLARVSGLVFTTFNSLCSCMSIGKATIFSRRHATIWAFVHPSVHLSVSPPVMTESKTNILDTLSQACIYSCIFYMGREIEG